MNNSYFNIPPEREIVSSRVFTHPREKVFDAWENPELLKRWWGPAGFTNTFHEFNFHPGGRWRFTMHGPEKGNYENEAEFLQIDPPSLIAWQRISQPLFRVVTTFEDTKNGNTRLTFRMQFDTEEGCEKIRRFAVEKNEENFDKLEGVLST